MPVEVRVPAMGESVVEATVTRWLKKEGDTVAPGEAVVELETDKVNMEVPADAGGVLQSFAVQEGDTVNVGALLATLSDGIGQAPPAPNNGGAGLVTSPGPSSNGTSDPSITPLAARLAEENGVDLRLVKGTGPGGRVTKEDVANQIERASGAPATANVQAEQTVQQVNPSPESTHLLASQVPPETGGLGEEGFSYTPPASGGAGGRFCPASGGAGGRFCPASGGAGGRFCPASGGAGGRFCPASGGAGGRFCPASGGAGGRFFTPRRARQDEPPPPDHCHAAGGSAAHGGHAHHVQRD